MANYSRAEVAERAGVDLDYVDRLLELGVLTPKDGGFGSGDVRRATIVRTLERSGVPLDGIGAAVRSGALSRDFVGHNVP